ncbi:MAG: multiheme c-type cytochrome [Rubripirellula sp.]|nr:multiheme c-type cytochrome [Rubripirellula sp.]
MKLFAQRLITAASLGFMATCGIAQDGIAQDAAPVQDKAPTLVERLSDPVYMSWMSHNDVKTCVKCHLAGPNVGEIIGDVQSNLTAFSRRKEMDLWVLKDKHTIARRRVEPFDPSRTEAELKSLMEQLDTMAGNAARQLQDKLGIEIDSDQVGLTKFPKEWIGESNFLSRRICDKLWGEGSSETEEGYGKFRENCLTCHGGYQGDDTGFELDSTAQAKIGIGCLYCHQQGDNPKWIADHAAPNPEQNWRLLPAEVKSTAGMRDLANTAKQADLCFDCHVGNRSKNMFVTHEMYAAGHPPIPSIELHTFCGEMPQHWQTPSQLHDSLSASPTRDAYFTVNYPGVSEIVGAGKTYWNTRKMLLGALVARKKTLDLITETANAHTWGDYSLYDCASCHHELDSDSLRQQRGFPGAPGRPRQHEWSTALLNIALEFDQPESAAQAKQAESKLTAAFAAEPFGDPNRVAKTATALADELEKTIAAVEKKPVDAAVAMNLLQKLAQTPKNALLTYDAARQVVWAIQTIVDEMKSEGALQPDDPILQAAIDLGDASVSGLSSALPSGRKEFIYATLKGDLERRENYNPAKLKQQLTQFGKLLGVTQNAKLSVR